jgi:PBSX family phage terminase large subunit
MLGYQTPAEFRFKAFKEIGYHPTDFQAKVHRSNAKMRVVAAAARIGKTWLAAGEVNARIHYPRKQMIWCVGPTYEIARKVFREVWEYLTTPAMMKSHPMRIAKFDDMKIVLFNGTTIEGKSADNPKSLLGEGLDLIVVDEASRIPKEVYTRYLLTRLTTANGDILLISTPFGVNSYFHTLYLKGKNPDEKDDIESFKGTIHDQPLVSQEAIDRLYANKDDDPIGFKQEVLGEFVAHGGDVFPTFDEKTFFTDVPYNPNLPVECSIDHGFANPFSCLFIQRYGQQIRIIKEYYVQGKCDLDHTAYLKPIFEYYDVRFCVVDPREPNTRGIFAQEIPSCRFVPGVAKEINLGIQIIRDHLVIDPETNQPYLVADKDNCKKLLWEFLQAHYRKDGFEEVADKDNHALSCLRYYLLLRANRLNRTNLDHFTSTMKMETESSIFSGDDGIYSYRDFNDRLWMGDS